MIVAIALLALSIVSLTWLVAEDARASSDADARCRAFVCELTVARTQVRV